MNIGNYYLAIFRNPENKKMVGYNIKLGIDYLRTKKTAYNFVDRFHFNYLVSDGNPCSSWLRLQAQHLAKF